MSASSWAARSLASSVSPVQANRTLGRAILRLIPKPGVVEAKRMEFMGKDLNAISESAMRQVRGKQISMILQDPEILAESGDEGRRPDPGSAFHSWAHRQARGGASASSRY